MRAVSVDYTLVANGYNHLVQVSNVKILLIHLHPLELNHRLEQFANY